MILNQHHTDTINTLTLANISQIGSILRVAVHNGINQFHVFEINKTIH